VFLKFSNLIKRRIKNALIGLKDIVYIWDSIETPNYEKFLPFSTYSDEYYYLRAVTDGG
jgi:hypothetical protein